jgi:hypothetical protein
MVCGPTQIEEDTLCYDACRDGYKPIGPVCWGACDTATHLDCGGLCIEKGTGTCSGAIMNMVTQGMKAAGSIASGAISGEPDMNQIMGDLSGLGESLAFDICA